MIDRVERRLAQVFRWPADACRRASGVVAASAVQRDEPLRRGEEDHRVVAPPAVRILMRERLAVPQPAASFSASAIFGIRVEHPLAAEELHGVEEMPGRTDRRVDLQAVLHARC